MNPINDTTSVPHVKPFLKGKRKPKYKFNFKLLDKFIITFLKKTLINTIPSIPFYKTVLQQSQVLRNVVGVINFPRCIEC